jgi:hypothetical protein
MDRTTTLVNSRVPRWELQNETTATANVGEMQKDLLPRYKILLVDSNLKGQRYGVTYRTRLEFITLEQT